MKITGVYPRAGKKVPDEPRRTENQARFFGQDFASTHGETLNFEDDKIVGYAACSTNTARTNNAGEAQRTMRTRRTKAGNIASIASRAAADLTDQRKSSAKGA